MAAEDEAGASEHTDDSTQKKLKSRGLAAASTPAEWRMRGKKCFDQKLFSHASTCFRKSGDRDLEMDARAKQLWSNSRGLEASAPKLKQNMFKAGCWLLRSRCVKDAAQSFNAAREWQGAHDIAARLFCVLGEARNAAKCLVRVATASQKSRGRGQSTQVAELFLRASKLAADYDVKTALKYADRGQCFDQCITLLLANPELAHTVAPHRPGTPTGSYS